MRNPINFKAAVISTAIISAFLALIILPFFLPEKVIVTAAAIAVFLGLLAVLYFAWRILYQMFDDSI